MHECVDISIMDISSVQQSNVAMAQILQMAVVESTDMAEKMIPINLASEAGIIESSDTSLGSMLDVIA